MARSEVDYVQDVIREYETAYRYRTTWEAHWEEVADLVLPEYRGTLRTNSFWTPGAKRTQLQFDSTAPMALSKFSAILDSLLTPRNSFWHSLKPADESLLKDNEVSLWFEQATHVLFQHRYRTSANFPGQNLQNWKMLGAFGNCGMFIDQLDSETDLGLRYKALPIGEMYIKEDQQGRVDGVVRAFWMTARQMIQKWGPDTKYNSLPDKFVEAVMSSPTVKSEDYHKILHAVRPRADYDPRRIDVKGKKFESCYVFPQEMKLLQEGGFRTFPYAVSRYEQEPAERYGRGPAMIVLPAIKTINAQKKTFLTAGHRAINPTYLTHDDGIMDELSLRPGVVNRGGMTAEGKPLVGVLPTGKVEFTIEMMGLEAQVINDAFLVSLFQILTETPRMTATEVIERTREKGILLAPILGRQQTEYLEPMIEREVDLLAEMNLLPPMPPALMEAGGKLGAEFAVQYDSPLSRAQRAEEVGGVMRSVETVLNIVNITGDPAPLDFFNWDVIVPNVAQIQAVPPSWMNTLDKVQQIRQARAQAAERQQQAAEAPGVAALTKAAAVAQEKGLVGGRDLLAKAAAGNAGG